MSSSSEMTRKALAALGGPRETNELIKAVKNKSNEGKPSEKLPNETPVSTEGTQRRLDFLQSKTGHQFNFLTGNKRFCDPAALHGNIENFIGMTLVPTGVVGPLKVLDSAALAAGQFAQAHQKLGRKP